MAVGDAKLALTSVSANSYLAIQPASGEQWLMFEVGNSNVWGNSGDEACNGPYMNLYIYNGTSHLGMYYATAKGRMNARLWQKGFMMNNSVYGRILNSVYSGYVSYSAIQEG